MCHLKQILLLSSFSANTHTHTLITPLNWKHSSSISVSGSSTHTHTHAEMHKAATHIFPPPLVNAEKNQIEKTRWHLHSRPEKLLIASVYLRWWKKVKSESKGEVKAGHEGDEVSHFPSCKAVWERGPMRAGRVAATFWAERQVRARGRSKEEAHWPACYWMKKTERERGRGGEIATHNCLFLC